MRISKDRKNTMIRVAIFTLGLLFLYLPIVTLIIYSFNESRMVTVWTETSLKWYRALFHNEEIIRAVGISLIVALMTAATSVVIGTLAAFVLVRVGRFKGESLFVLLMTAPMVLPEVITGLALLLIFVTLGSEIPIFANRGIWAIWIAHVTFCSAYTTVVIRSRFRELDISIEEAAMDLGAGPVKVFFAVILPALMPSEVAAFLLAFTMSMDDLVITSFIAGPDSNTLPMLIFSSVRRGLSPEINALATIIVFIVSIFTFFAWLSMVKKQKRKRADAAKAASAAANEQKLHYNAPHDGARLDSRYKLAPEVLAILKDQAAALMLNQDTAAETTLRLRQLNSGPVPAPAAATPAQAVAGGSIIAAARPATVSPIQAAGQTVPAAPVGTDGTTAFAAKAAETGSVSSAGTVAESCRHNVDGSMNTDEIAAVTAAATAAATEALKKTAPQDITPLGESAKDATAKQRIVSSTLAQAGMVKVVDQSAQVMVPPSETISDSARTDDVSAEAVPVKSSNATTASSLAVAKARKAALKSAMSQAIEHVAAAENDIAGGMSTSTKQSPAPKTTTVTELTEVKTKKISRAAQDNSAMAVTMHGDELVKSATSKVKVIDITAPATAVPATAAASAVPVETDSAVISSAESSTPASVQIGADPVEPESEQR